METLMTEVKGLLSIDGGGIRGVMAAEILVKSKDRICMN
jgi:patatin-like phospholipase/acyl hydrolase